MTPVPELGLNIHLCVVVRHEGTSSSGEQRAENVRSEGIVSIRNLRSICREGRQAVVRCKATGIAGRAALLGFNLGVEAGQLTFVVVVLAAYIVQRRLVPALAHSLRAPRAAGTPVLGYGIGINSTWWLAERAAGF